jgi:hypothetical protein
MQMKATKTTHCIITNPEKANAPAIVLYGGLRGREGDWFLKQNRIPDSMLQNSYLILPTHFTYSCQDCINEFERIVGPIRGTQYSLCGFSRGGIEVYRYAATRQWKILGLIDPSAPTMGGFGNNVLDNYKGAIRAVYWVPHWTAFGEEVPNFAQHLRDLGVKMIEQNISHEGMPAFFFDRYGFDFLQ